MDPTDPVPAALSPTRTTATREIIRSAESTGELTDPVGAVVAAEYPTIHRLQTGLIEDQFAQEFTAGLHAMLDRIEQHLDRLNGTSR